MNDAAGSSLTLNHLQNKCVKSKCLLLCFEIYRCNMNILLILISLYFIGKFVIFLWKGFSDEIPCVQFSFCFLRLHFYFVNYVIVSCGLPYYNSFDHQMLLKN